MTFSVGLCSDRFIILMVVLFLSVFREMDIVSLIIYDLNVSSAFVCF